MMKTLTEQWRDGKLPDGTYYINLVGGIERVDFFDRIEWARTKDFRIEEVLAPVPSYDEYKKLESKCLQLEKELVLNKLEPIHLHNCLARISELEEKNKNAKKKVKKLQEQLEIAKKALKDIDVRSQRDWNEYDCMGCAKKALYDIEMEGVK